MHEAALAQAALPAPTSILGLPLQAYSLGHELFLIREGNPLAAANRETKANLDERDLVQAVLICCHSFEECRRLHTDWLMGLKLWLWRRRLKRMARSVTGDQLSVISHQPPNFLQEQFEGVRLYQALGRLEVPVSLERKDLVCGKS